MVRHGQKLTQQIRSAVDASGLSRYAICKATGIDKGHMSRFMAGKCWLSAETLDALAELLKLEIVAAGKRLAKRSRIVGRSRKDR